MARLSIMIGEFAYYMKCMKSCGSLVSMTGEFSLWLADENPIHPELQPSAQNRVKGWLACQSWLANLPFSTIHRILDEIHQWKKTGSLVNMTGEPCPLLLPPASCLLPLPPASASCLCLLPLPRRSPTINFFGGPTSPPALYVEEPLPQGEGKTEKFDDFVLQL